jgi:hypothetical protein
VKIVGYTCCVNYGDMLTLTYAFNKRFLDEYIVVTSHFDQKTIDFCKKNNIICIESEIWTINGSKFNKSAMLNKAIDYCLENFFNEEYWYLCLDADTIVDVVDTHNLVHLVKDQWVMCGSIENAVANSVRLDRKSELNRILVYGAPRKIIDRKNYFRDNTITLDILRDQSVGYWFHYPYDWYAYVGQFQLYWKRTAKFDTSYTTANDCDTAFLNEHFTIANGKTLNNVVCYHLGDAGKNHVGRATEDWSDICSL